METKQKPLSIRILKITLNTLFYLVILMLLIFSIANIKLKKVNDIANIFGIGFLSVQSESMEGNLPDSFFKGDLIIVKMINEKNIDELKELDVVTFFDLNINQFNTHRIIRMEDEEGVMITKGDANSTEDDPISIDQVLAKHITTIKGLGKTLDRLQEPSGFALYIILPVAIILLIEGFFLTKNIIQINRIKMEEKYAKEKESAKQTLELEKEKMRKELLKELKGQNNQTS